jgi:Helix-turn-helix domain
MTTQAHKEAAHHAAQMRLMTPPAAATYLGVVVGTLAKWRHFGEGPAYVKYGSRIFYEREILDAWIDAHRCNSTSEAA